MNVDLISGALGAEVNNFDLNLSLEKHKAASKRLLDL